VLTPVVLRTIRLRLRRTTAPGRDGIQLVSNVRRLESITRALDQNAENTGQI
jgi:hypothetical protein